MSISQAERRTMQGVAVISVKKSAITSTLERIGIPYRTLLLQEGGALPPMRLPILLDPLGLRLLELARTLDNLASGRMQAWKAGTPIPVITLSAPAAYAQQRLLACCPAVVAVIAEQIDPQALPMCLQRFGQGGFEPTHGPLWFGLAQPPLPMPRPDLNGLLIALSSAPKLHDVAAAWHVSRATFFRRLDPICAALAIERPPPGCPAERWLATLLAALAAPY